VIVPETEVTGGVRGAAARTAWIAGGAALAAATIALASTFVRRRRTERAIRTYRRLRLPRPAPPNVSAADD
jgi:hypothetical protein